MHPQLGPVGGSETIPEEQLHPVPESSSAGPV